MFVRMLFNIFLVVVAAGIVSVSENPEKECKDHSAVFEYVEVSAHNCAEGGVSNQDVMRLQQAESLEYFQQFFVGYCRNQSVVRECFARQTSYFERYANHTYVTAFNFYRSILETILDVECNNGGDRLAKFWHGMVDKSIRRALGETIPCIRRVKEFTSDIERSTIDVPSQVYVAYKETGKFKECVYQVEMESSFKQVIDTLLGEVLEKMKCINPKDGSMVLCSTIDLKLLNVTNICDVKTNNNEIPIYDALENQAFRCYDFFLVRSYTRDRTYFFRRICEEDTYGVKRCMDVIRPDIANCLNETQQHEFAVFNETIHQSFKGACIDNGEPLADIMGQAYEWQIIPGNINPFLECLDAVKSSRKQTAVGNASHNMRFYRELETFKECFVKKLQGNQNSLQVVTKLYNEIRKGVKCFNKEDGTTVLCETLVQ